jgi:hypothetical protein
MAGTGKRPWPSRPRELDEPDHPAGGSADLWIALGETAEGDTGSDQARAGRLVARLDRLRQHLYRGDGAGQSPGALHGADVRAGR